MMRKKNVILSLSKGYNFFYRRTFLSLILCLSTFVSSSQYTQYVNPFIGTGGHGHTFPGAVVPFGMVALSPDTRIDGSWDGCSGYHYSDSIIYGFSHTHLSGTGCSDLGDIMLMPTSQTTTDKYIYSSKFSHKFESAKAGMYDVYLSDDKINVSLTATAHCGFHEYKWNNNNERKIVLDLRHRDELLDGEIEIVSPSKIEGYRRSKAWAVDQWCFYSIEFSEPIKVLYNANGEELKPEIGIKLTGKNVAACFIFSAGTTMMVKVGISGTDKQGARKNLQAEIPHWDFENIYKQADSLWNKELSCIEVDNITKKINAPLSGGEGPGVRLNDKYTIFYTALYHCFIHPSINNDVDHRYRGRDGKIHIADSFDYYTVFSLWDTYRALHPLFNIVQRKRNLDFIKTFLAHYDQVGRLPVWELWGNETDCMIGYHAVSVIADAYNKGIRDFDVEKAYKAMTSIANSNWRGLDIYRKKGYLEVEDESESVSKTLEYSYDDWCIAQMSDPIKRNEYIKRSNGFFNIFDKETGFNRPRINGGWQQKFNPYEVNNNYTEANAWQYMFGMQHMLDGMKVYIGRNQIEKMLDSMFSTTNKTSGREQADISGMLGQYAHGNEPSHHLAYMYNIINKPWKTDSIVHLIIDSFYKNTPNGLIGNEDCGQMSAWYVFSSIGMYPTCPGSDEYTFVAPSFNYIKVSTFKDRILTISKNNYSFKNKYVSSIEDRLARYKMQKIKLYDKHAKFLTSSKSSYLRLFTDTIVFNYGDEVPASNRFSTCHGCETEQLNKILNGFVAVPIIESTQGTFKDKLSIKILRPQLKETGLSDFYTPDLVKRYLAIQIDSNPIAYINTEEYNLVIDKNSNFKTWIKQDADGKILNSKITTATYYKIPHNWTINITSTAHPQYTAGGSDALIDGLLGSIDWRKGRWQGYQGQDLELVLDLQKIQTINEVGGSFLQDVGPWIMMPKEMIIYTSNDTINFTEVGRASPESYSGPLSTAIIADTMMETTIQNIIYKFPKPIQARYIKIKAINYGNLPQWHVSRGEPAYIFVDEVWVK